MPADQQSLFPPRPNMVSEKWLEPFLSGFEPRAVEWLGLAQYGSGLAHEWFRAKP